MIQKNEGTVATLLSVSVVSIGKGRQGTCGSVSHLDKASAGPAHKQTRYAPWPDVMDIFRNVQGRASRCDPARGRFPALACGCVPKPAFRTCEAGAKREAGRAVDMEGGVAFGRVLRPGAAAGGQAAARGAAGGAEASPGEGAGPCGQM